ncbi:hypothetical protein ABH935_005897 [Catenulispora sp. GAS73]|uniref:hypothetical protein n=1 Tax=Catenulispora sp. GAS73 TaxID=3156269 RepID=UPI003517B189
MSSVDILAGLGPSAEARAVARVLSAAAAPPWPHELRGYESARRAFENAGAAPVRGGTHSAGTRAGAARAGVGVPLRRLIGVKLAAVAGALTVTGVAVAAEADVLPSPIQRAAHQVLGGVGVPDPDPGPRGEQTMASSPGTSGVPGSQGGPGSQGLPGSQGSQGSHPGQLLPPNSQGTDQASDGGSSAGSLPGTPVGTADTPGQSAASTPAADVLALCRTYVAHQGNGDANGKGNGKGNGGLNDHDRSRLAALAGGEDKISAFCAQVLAAASGAPIPQPTGASTPTSPTSTPTSKSASPDPSHDHKPAANTSSSAPGFGPVSTSSQDGGGGKHRRVPK